MPTTVHPVAIVGCGYTNASRAPTRSESELAAEACRNAISDAGLTVADIDGLNLQVHHYPPPDAPRLMAKLGISSLRWRVDGGMGVTGLATAAAAIDVGACTYALVCKVVNTVAPVTPPTIDLDTGAVGGPEQFEVPYGLGYTMQRVGLIARRWMHRYGIQQEQVGWLCVSQRASACLNERAIFRKPLTVSEYLQSRLIADPVRLLDCDYPINAAYAYILTRATRASALRHPPVHVLSWIVSEHDHDHFHTAHLLPEDDTRGPSPWLKPLYVDARVAPLEIDLWMLYDGFSYIALQWMESLGFVGRGEAGAYVAGGTRIAINGEHPTNTNGGHLSEGRSHGAGHILEAVQQLRGTAGPRQANRHDLAVVTSGYAHAGSAAILAGVRP